MSGSFSNKLKIKHMKTKNLKFSTLFALLILFSVGFYSCKDDEDDEDLNNNGVSQQDRDFAARASAANIAEIEFGELAVDRALNDSVIAFAERMIEEHTGAQEQLDSLASWVNITVPDSMDAAHRTLFTDLSRLNGSAFDSAYIHNQVIDHQNTRDLLQKQIDDGENDSLVNYASRLLPIVISHHQDALYLRDSTEMN